MAKKKTQQAENIDGKEEEDEEKKDSKTTYAFLVFLGALVAMLAIIILVPRFFHNGTPGVQDSYKYNYFDFIEVNNVWYTTTQEGDNLLRVSLRHGPKELENISVVGNITAFKDRNDFMYVTFDPRKQNHDGYVTLAVTELSTPLVAHFGKDIAAGCSFPDPVCNETNTSIITCTNTDKGVIYLYRTNRTSVVISGNCAILSGNDENLIRSVDRFLYGMYGIMK
jgi:hypothetical protein